MTESERRLREALEVDERDAKLAARAGLRGPALFINVSNRATKLGHVAGRELPALLAEVARLREALENIRSGCKGFSSEWHRGTKPCPSCAPWAYASMALGVEDK